MIKLVALYRRPPDTADFDTHFANTHVPLIRQFPGLRRDAGLVPRAGQDRDAAASARGNDGSPVPADPSSFDDENSDLAWDQYQRNTEDKGQVG